MCMCSCLKCPPRSTKINQWTLNVNRSWKPQLSVRLMLHIPRYLSLVRCYPTGKWAPLICGKRNLQQQLPEVLRFLVAAKHAVAHGCKAQVALVLRIKVSSAPVSPSPLDRTRQKCSLGLRHRFLKPYRVFVPWRLDEPPSTFPTLFITGW